MKKVSILIILLLLIASTFAILTKLDIIPNVFKISILCPEDDIVIPNEENTDDDISENPEEKEDYPEMPVAYKPVIYLYPEKEQNVKVNLEYSGKVFVTYPEYNNGWNVIAKPNGSLINIEDNKEYSYLFWEGKNNIDLTYDMSEGFVVRGSESLEFLQKKLSLVGLTPREYNEFIVYWLPQMIENDYNLVHFATKEEYDDKVILDINPRPDSVLRVFMVLEKISDMKDVKPQSIDTFERNGFTVIEWGGTIL
jgi:hypothetical protein